MEATASTKKLSKISAFYVKYRWRTEENVYYEC